MTPQEQIEELARKLGLFGRLLTHQALTDLRRVLSAALNQKGDSNE